MTPRWLFAPVIFVGCLIAVVGVSRRAPMPEVMVSSAASSHDVRRCAECHDEIVQSFAAAPHHNTLQPIQAPGIRELFAGREVRLLADRFRFTADGDELNFAAERFPADCTVAWVFGSGHHARTPVALRDGPRGETELVQLHVSWFADGVLDVTPGSEKQGELAPSLGIHHTAAETRRCFACHTSYLPVEQERIQFARLKAGINCSRCHTQTSSHLAAGGEVPTDPDWSTLGPLEAINRCGECHRRADEFTADELSPAASHLARFAPVGLVQSACFRATHPPASAGNAANVESTRLDCVTCHDPHQPAQTEPWFYVEKCLRCHNSTPQSAPDCRAQPMNTQCLECHMPKVATNAHLSFTDHWIRIHRLPAGDVGRN